MATTQTEAWMRSQGVADQMPRDDEPKAVESITLAALPSAVTSAESFVVSTLTRWHARISLHAAVVLAEELVRNAVSTVGIPDPAVAWSQADSLETLSVQLLSFKDSIGIEVSDSASCAAVDGGGAALLAQSLLEVLQSTASRWGIVPADRGRVVWAQLPVFSHAATGLPLRPLVPSPRPRTPLDPSVIPDEDLLRKVRDGLKAL